MAHDKYFESPNQTQKIAIHKYFLWGCYLAFIHNQIFQYLVVRQNIMVCGYKIADLDCFNWHAQFFFYHHLSHLGEGLPQLAHIQAETPGR